MSLSQEEIHPVQIKFLTLNCWGLKYVSAHRQERIHAIADFLASSSNVHSRSSSLNSIEPFSDAPNQHQNKYFNTTSSSPVASQKNSFQSSNQQPLFESHSSKPFDVVALQELWVYHDFLVIRDRAKEGGFKFSKWFHSAALGSGLAILSRFPIISSHFHPYSLNGHPLHFIQGDFFVGKSVGSCLLDVPMVGEVEVFTTHLYAPHDVPAPEWKRAHRTAQAWELAKLVRSSAERGRAVIVCGDLNSVPTSLPIKILQSYGQLRDSWTAIQSSRANGGIHTTNEDSYRSAIQDEGMTCDSMLNTFTSSKNPANRGAKGFGKRLDYILFRPASRRITRRDNHGHCRSEFVDDQDIICNHCQVILIDPIPVFGYSYSDHFAVEATLTIHSNGDQLSSTTTTTTTTEEQMKLKQINQQTHPAPNLTTEHLNNCISALMIKYRSSEKSSQIQLILFFISFFLLTPGISIAASFQPLKYLNWIFTLLSILVGAFGITMLYSGFLAGNWERSAIQEICDQVQFEIEARLKNHHLLS